MTTQEMQDIQTLLLRELPPKLVREQLISDLIEQSVNEHLSRLMEELAAFRFETEQRFDRVDGGVERLEGRMVRQEGRLESLYERVEGTEERLGKLELQMLYARRDIGRNGAQLSYVIRRLDGLNAWIKVIEGKKGSDKGQNLEETFATALRFGLQNPDIAPENIRLRVKLTDTEGLVYKPGFTTEVDIIIEDRRWTVFEIKASAVNDDVPSFHSKLELIRLQQPGTEIRGVIFSCAEDAALKECCRAYQIELIEPFTALLKYEPEDEPLPDDLPLEPDSTA